MPSACAKRFARSRRAATTLPTTMSWKNASYITTGNISNFFASFYHIASEDLKAGILSYLNNFKAAPLVWIICYVINYSDKHYNYLSIIDYNCVGTWTVVSSWVAWPSQRSRNVPRSWKAPATASSRRSAPTLAPTSSTGPRYRMQARVRRF